MKKFLSVIMALVLLLGVLSLPAAANYTPPFSVEARAVYLVNTDTNLILYEKDAETQLCAASLTKLMTVILMLESYQDQLDSVSITSSRYIYDILYGKDASTADIRSGETHTLRNLLYAMLLPSANEAAYMVADFMGGGSVDNFVAMMNKRAGEIGCTATVFTDPCGLDAGNLTTARDMYLLLRYAMSFDAFVAACGTEKWDMGENSRYSAGSYNIYNTDRMVCPTLGGYYFRSYTQGGKTGTLEEWQNFAGWHTQNGENYISVVLNSPDSVDPYEEYVTPRPALFETGELMDWVYDSFTIDNALTTTAPITEIPVKYSTKTDTLSLYPASEMRTVLPLDADETTTEKTFYVPESVAAPIHKGDVIGTVELRLNDEVLGTVDLLAQDEVPRNLLLFTLCMIGDFFGSLYFRVFVILSLIALFAYIPLALRRENLRRKNRNKRRR